MAVINLGLTAQTTGLTPLYDPAYPTGNRPAPSGTETITGTGFGTGPTVVLFDSMQNHTAGASIGLSDAEIGAWAGYNNVTSGSINDAVAVSEDSRLWMALRDPATVAVNTKYSCGLRADFAKSKEFFISYKWRIANGMKQPGASVANTIGGNASNWKMCWLWDSVEGDLAGDLVTPTWYGPTSCGFLGNAFDPDSTAGGRFTFSTADMDGAGDNLFSYYQSDNSTGVTGTNDGDVETMAASASGYSRETRSDVDPWDPNSWSGNSDGYNRLLLGGWIGNVGANGYTNVQVLHCDFYLATGSNSRARIITHNATTLAASTESYVIPPDTWSDTSITFTPQTYQDLTYRSVVQSDGTIQENV